jgi:hypothetical protein
MDRAEYHGSVRWDYHWPGNGLDVAQSGVSCSEYPRQLAGLWSENGLSRHPCQQSRCRGWRRDHFGASRVGGYCGGSLTCHI